MDSLLHKTSSYRLEKLREKKSRITGSGRGKIYVSNWYAYEAFSFLGDRNHPGNTQDTLGEVTTYYLLIIILPRNCSVCYEMSP
ncbi:unnamed protein product [Parnassius apollo]|uniref:(apollo) hypothetical protein n=1 Tax=Parnassius apollo TaxID=110799 RepID=A0A8S3Y1D9_PARAO|nr:unnamed protein product [Parnassius apollo]